MKTTLRKLTTAWPLVILLLLPALTRAETAVQAWVQRYNGTGNGSDQATAVAVDGSNNVIVTGYSEGGGGNYDYVTIKYSMVGVPLWTNRYNGLNGTDEATAVAVDGSNNVIVTGWSDTGFGEAYATIKYSSTGVPLWTNRYGGTEDYSVKAYAVAVDGSDNVIVTGFSATIKYSSTGLALWTNVNVHAEAVAVDGSNNVIVTGFSGSIYDYATVKYSSAGVPLWTNVYNGPGNYWDEACAVAVDGSNNVIVTGYSASTNLSAHNYDYATIKYSSAGEPLWTNRYNGPGDRDDYACAVTVDSSNNVIVTGYSADSQSFPHYATIKYSPAGESLWTNRYNGPGNGDDWANAVAVDASNNVIVTGYSTGSAGGYATIKYSAAGVPLWTNLYNGPGGYGYNEGSALAVDRSGNVIVTGYSLGSGGVHDYATVKYTCVPSPVVSGLQLTNGTFQMRVDGVLQPGTLVIVASTNLSTTNWAPVFTNTTPTNVLFYTDPDAGNRLRRFYRAFQFP